MFCQKSNKECDVIPVELLDQHHLYLDKHTNQTRSEEEHAILRRNDNTMISHLNHSNREKEWESCHFVTWLT